MNLFSLPTTSLASPAGSAGTLGRVFSQETPDTSAASGPSFAQTLQSAFGQVNDLQVHAGQMATSFAQGKTSDIHTVMIASEQASMALQLTTQIRNKAVDAYQEIMRISM